MFFLTFHFTIKTREMLTWHNAPINSQEEKQILVGFISIVWSVSCLQGFPAK
jgi:hypothetical protein